MNKEWATLIAALFGIAMIGVGCWIMGWEQAARVAWALGCGIIGTLSLVGAIIAAMGNTDGPPKSGNGTGP